MSERAPPFFANRSGESATKRKPRRWGAPGLSWGTDGIGGGGARQIRNYRTARTGRSLQLGNLGVQFVAALLSFGGPETAAGRSLSQDAEQGGVSALSALKR